MYILEKEKNACNNHYQMAISKIYEGNLFSAKQELFLVMEKLVAIGKLSACSSEKEKCEKKIKHLLLVAKELSANGFTKNVANMLGIEFPQITQSLCETEFEKKDDYIIQCPDTNPPTDEIMSPCDPPENANIAPDQTPHLSLNDFVGQDKIKKQLSEAILASNIKNTAINHILLYGSAGLGKTTLARIISYEKGTKIHEINAPTIKDIKDLINIFTKINQHDILFIDEIHRLNKTIYEAIYTAMQDGTMSYINSSGENALIKLPPFTIIGATTHSGLLEKPFRDRFYLQLKLEEYSLEDLTQIGLSTIIGQGLSADLDCVELIAKRSRNTPRILIGNTKRICDKAIVLGLKHITSHVAEQFFEDIEVDELGLTALDRKILTTLVDKYCCNPVGLDVLCASLGENKNIIENQCEPYLIKMGFLGVGPCGRFATESAKKYIRGE